MIASKIMSEKHIRYALYSRSEKNCIMLRSQTDKSNKLIRLYFWSRIIFLCIHYDYVVNKIVSNIPELNLWSLIAALFDPRHKDCTKKPKTHHSRHSHHSHKHTRKSTTPTRNHKHSTKPSTNSPFTISSSIGWWIVWDTNNNNK